ncbi:fructokinase [Microbacterium sp. ZKA21]|uniref:carbohydrate kinase family protein n=1 Tax=Microbacterium sp. ZKA21 TaxID=3381694 RepID=UPI003D1E804D
MTDRSEIEVLVVGEALVDIVETAGVSSEHVGGSPANVALGLGRRGVPVALLTQIAMDTRGLVIVEHLSASGVDVLPESMTASATSTARAVIGTDGQAEYDFDIAWEAFPAPVDLAPRVVHTGSIAAFLAPGAASVVGLLRSADAAVVTFDPNIRPALVVDRAGALRAYEAVAGLADVVKMSDQDAEWLHPGKSIDGVIDAVLALGPSLVAITLGSDGAVVATADHRVTIPAVSVAAVDTIGAGDTFMASLIHSVLEHGTAGLDAADLTGIGLAAAGAAAITVSRVGADLPWAEEL